MAEDYSGFVDLDDAERLARADVGHRNGETVDSTKGGDSDDTFSVERMNRDHAFVLLGGKPVILKETEGEQKPVDDQNRFITVEAFKLLYYNRHVEQRGADGKKKIFTWAEAWLKSKDRRTYHGIEFHPDPRNEPGTPGYLNIWRGFAVTPAPKPNGYALFRDHLLKNVCAGNERHFAWVFAFFAHVVQRPRERIGVALVLRGRQGAGKTVVGELFGALFPKHYFLVDDARYIVGNFNSFQASCLLLQADEAVWAGDKAAEGRLRGLVSSSFQLIELKGVDPVKLMNFVRVIMTSNENWVIPAGEDERRFAVLDVAPHRLQDHGYFGAMKAEMENGGYAALLHDLLGFDLNSVDLRTIPKTAALLYQKERSLDSIPDWWLTRLHSGCSTRHSDGWETPVKKDLLYADYIKISEEIGIKRRSAESVFHTELKRLIPGLAGRRLRIRGQGEDGGFVEKRPRYYDLPKLKDCRAAWDERMGQTRDWPPEDEPLERREGEAVDDF